MRENEMKIEIKFSKNGILKLFLFAFYEVKDNYRILAFH